jgi:energy-coupling factor transporter ATP-binding protein EcfA2
MSILSKLRKKLQGSESRSEDNEITITEDDFLYDLEPIGDGSGIMNLNGNPREVITKTRNATDGKGDSHIYMGDYPREMIESNIEDAYSPLYFGYNKSPSGMATPYGIEIDKLFKHLGIFGKTGTGKSTLLKMLMLQVVYAGFGMVYIDPKGEDSYEFLQLIPDERLDDVIFLKAEQPKSQDKTIGFNYLSVPVENDHEYYDTFVNSQVDFIKDTLDVKSGKRMKSVIDNSTKAMIRSEKNYTLIDLYFILSDEERREAFAESVEEEQSKFIAEFTKSIAKMDDDDLEPVYRRIREWTESPLTREMVAHPNTTVEPMDILDNDKIVVIDSQSNDDSLRRFFALSIIEQMWSAVRQRDMLNKDHKPFFMFVDEFASLFREDTSSSKIGQILSEARSFKTSFILSTQSTSQIPSDLWQTDVVENVNTFISLKVGQNAAGMLAPEFQETKQSDLQALQDYESYNKYEGEDGNSVFKIQHFPDYPPVRSEDKIDDIIENSLERYGEDRLTEEEMEDNLHIPSMDDVETDDSIPEKIDQIINAVYVSLIYEAGTSDTDTLTNTYVAEDTVKTVLNEIYNTTKDYKFSATIEENSTYFDQKRSNNGMKVTLTTDGIGNARSTQSGEAGSGGKSSHRYLLKQTRDLLAKYGIEMRVPSQGGESLPDGIAHPTSLDAESSTEFKYPYVNREFEVLSEDPFVVEAETSTFEKPVQSLSNLRKAYTDNDYCLFTVKNKEDARKLEQILNTGYSREYTDGGTLLYNYNNNLKSTIKAGDDAYPLRPADSGRTTSWIQKNGELYLVESSSDPIDYNNAIINLKNPESVYNITLADYPAYYVYTHTDGYQVYQNGQQIETYDSKEKLKENWKQIKKPFIIEEEFQMKTTPSQDNYAILILPEEDSETNPTFYKDGDKYPLTLDTDATEHDRETEEDESKEDTTFEDDPLTDAIMDGIEDNNGEPPTLTDNRDNEDDSNEDDDNDNPFL